MATNPEYDVILTPQPEGGFTVIVPELPDVVTEGETREEALEMAREGIAAYLETVQELDYPVRRGLRERVTLKPV